MLLFIALIIAMIMSPNLMTKRFNQSTLVNLQEWWTNGAPKQHDQAIPGELMKQWFGSSDAIDRECRYVFACKFPDIAQDLRVGLNDRQKYAEAAEDAVSQNVSEIMRVVNSPQEAVGAVLLLDQIPRNIFRGSAAQTVCACVYFRSYHRGR